MKYKLDNIIAYTLGIVTKMWRKAPAFRHGDISRGLSSCIRHLRVV